MEILFHHFMHKKWYRLARRGAQSALIGMPIHCLTLLPTLTNKLYYLPNTQPFHQARIYHFRPIRSRLVAALK